MFMMTPTILRPSLLAAFLKPQDVFATSLYTASSTQQSVTNGLDLIGRGGLFWEKTRSISGDNYLVDTARGAGKVLVTNSTSSEFSADNYPTFLSNGFRVPGGMYPTGTSLVSQCFARAAKFFDTNVFTHTNGTPTNIDLSSLGVVGDAVVKRRDAAGDWYAWHRSLTAGNNLRLNTTDAQSATNAFISVSGTTLTFSASAPSGSYTYQARAHDPSADGIVQCGSTTISNGVTNIPHGWSGGAQWLLYKVADNSSAPWYIYDTARSGANFAGTDPFLLANSSAAENPSGNFLSQSGGVLTMNDGTPGTYIWCVIRAPY